MDITANLSSLSVRPNFESNPGERRLQSRERDNQSARSASNNTDTFSRSSSGRIRIIQVAKDGVRIDELSNRAENRNTNSVSRNLPQNQYVSNQLLVEDEALSQQIGVDVYA